MDEDGTVHHTDLQDQPAEDALRVDSRIVPARPKAVIKVAGLDENYGAINGSYAIRLSASARTPIAALRKAVLLASRLGFKPHKDRCCHVAEFAIWEDERLDRLPIPVQLALHLEIIGYDVEHSGEIPDCLRQHLLRTRRSARRDRAGTH